MKIMEKAKTFVGKHPSVKTGALLVTGAVIGRAVAGLLIEDDEFEAVDDELSELEVTEDYEDDEEVEE